MGVHCSTRNLFIAIPSSLPYTNTIETIITPGASVVSAIIRRRSTMTIEANVGTTNRVVWAIWIAIGAYATFSHHISELFSGKHPCSANFKRFEL